MLRPSYAELRLTIRSVPWPRRFSSAGPRADPVAEVSSSALDLDSFREKAFRAEKPLLVRHDGQASRGELPALRRWFAPQAGDKSAAAATLSPYLEPHAMTAILPYELMYPPQWALPDTSSSTNSISGFQNWLRSDETDTVRLGLAELLQYQLEYALGATQPPALGQRLVQMNAPLALFLAAVAYNNDPGRAIGDQPTLTQLYIAQASLSALPDDLQRDLPAPDLVREAGRGDVYNTSLWLGLEPTFTPWHRDPNPNIFCQLCSGKTIRLTRPAAGEQIFQRVQTELMRQKKRGGGIASHSRFRGEEMMQGPERLALHDAIWGSGAPRSQGEPETYPGTATGLQEAQLDPGDMLFIPKGWWHSVKSAFSDGRLNASANWWFR